MLSDGTLDIEALCKSKSLTIGIVKGRVYKGILDEMVSKYQITEVFTVRHGADHLGVLTRVGANHNK